jgi:PAS domain-containing protein
MFETDGDGEWTWVNRAMLDMTRRSSEQLLGYGWKNIVVPTERVAVSDEWSLAVRDGRECSVRFHLLKRYGAAPDYEVTLTSTPIRASTMDEPVGYFGLLEVVK